MRYYCGECKFIDVPVGDEPCNSCKAYGNPDVKGNWEPIEPAPAPIDVRVLDELLDEAIGRLQVIEHISPYMDMEHARGIIADTIGILDNMQSIINPKPFKTACESGLKGTNEPPEETIWQLGDRITDLVRELQGRLRKMGENNG